jgi:hypothetical protein
MLKTSASFRYCMLSNQYFQNKFQTNYLSLNKIASLLIEIYAEAGKPKPLAICIQDTVTERYTVIGVMPMSSSSNTRKKYVCSE